MDGSNRPRPSLAIAPVYSAWPSTANGANQQCTATCERSLESTAEGDGADAYRMKVGDNVSPEEEVRSLRYLYLYLVNLGMGTCRRSVPRA